MLTLAEAAKRLDLSPSTLRWQIRNGKLRARKVGPLWTVSEREVARYRKENRRMEPNHQSRPHWQGGLWKCVECGAELEMTRGKTGLHHYRHLEPSAKRENRRG